MTTDQIKCYHDTVQRIYEREESRRGDVEKQALTVLGVTGLVASLTTGLGGILLGVAEKGRMGFTLFLAVDFVCILLAFAFALYHALLALKRIPIHILFPHEVPLLPEQTADEYLLNVSNLLAEITTKNYAKTDFKVDNLRSSQTYLQLGIAFILIGGAGTAIVSLLML